MIVFDTWTLLRLVFYVFSVTASLACLGRFLTIRRPLARLFAVIMGAWTINTGMLIILLLQVVLLDSLGGQVLRTLNAALLAASPIGLYVLLCRLNGQAHER